jgi:hypothetical protein
MTSPQNGDARTFDKTRTSETVLQRITALRAPRKLLGLELSLLLFSIAVGIAAVVIIDLTVVGEPTTALAPTGALFVIALFALHITIRRIAPDGDPLIMPIAAFLHVIGIAMIYRGRGDRGAARDPQSHGAVPLHLPRRTRRRDPAAAADAPGHRPDHQRRARLDPRRRLLVPAG